MSKRIGQNHPCNEERGQWAYSFYFSSKKGLWQSFSGRYGEVLRRTVLAVSIAKALFLVRSRQNSAQASASGFFRERCPPRGEISQVFKSQRGNLLNTEKLNN